MNREMFKSKAAAVTAQMDEAAKQLTALLAELTGMIEALPDNPAIQRINERCFVMSSAA
jgi:hypothetical protein